MTRYRVRPILLLCILLLVPACTLPAGPPSAAPPEATSTPSPEPTPISLTQAAPTATLEPPASPALAEPELPGDNGATGGSPAGRPLVGIIAGHGGPESGAVHWDSGGVDLVEKDLTLSVALRLREVLESRGFGVVLDREKDVAVNARGADLNGDGRVDDADEIQARLDVINGARADVLISIHFNGFDSPAVRGTATYYCSDRPFDPQSRQLAEVVQESLVGSLRALGAEVVDKGVQDDSLLGKPYGHLMTLGPATPRITRPGKMPGVLVEPLFLTNEYEAGLLKEQSTLEAMAQGLARAIEAYLPPQPPTPTPTPTPARQAPVNIPQGETPREIVRGPAVPLVALTFDLGSGASNTPAILDTLEKQGIKTTFFMTGQWVEANPGLARRILELGHEAGNHSYSHPDLTKLSDQEVLEELSQMEEALQKATGKRPQPWFRPPFGARDGQVLGLVSRLGYRSVYWTLDSVDWRPEFPAANVLERVVSQASPGAIVVLHGDSPQTAQVLGSIISGLRARGLEPASLSRLLGE